MPGYTGKAPTATVVRRDPTERALEAQVNELLVGRLVVSATLRGGELTLTLSDGGQFTMRCEGGFTETKVN